jgi:hypothetical protein
MKVKEKIRRESVELVPYTCSSVQEILLYLQDKYKISQDDFDFANLMIVRLATGKLRRALEETLLEKHRLKQNERRR